VGFHYKHDKNVNSPVFQTLCVQLNGTKENNVTFSPADQHENKLMDYG
jgi:hypothetical protein